MMTDSIMPSPSQAEMDSDEFNAIWGVIKRWDINDPRYYTGYSSGNGSHVKILLDVIKPVIRNKKIDSILESGDNIKISKHEYPSSIGGLVHLSIQRKDGDEIVANWDFFQKIKNDLFGDESQMVEVYPKESNLVNYANIRHFWVLPNDYVIPFTT